MSPLQRTGRAVLGERMPTPPCASSPWGRPGVPAAPPRGGTPPSGWLELAQRRLLDDCRCPCGRSGSEGGTGSPLAVGRARQIAVQHLPLGRPRPLGIGHRHRLQQRLRVRMERMRVELVAWCALDDPAEVHHRDLVRDVLDDGEVVRDEEVGQPEVALQVGQQVDDLGLDRDVERARPARRRRCRSGSSASARATTIRCRCPPLNSCG